MYYLVMGRVFAFETVEQINAALNNRVSEGTSFRVFKGDECHVEQVAKRVVTESTVTAYEIQEPPS